VSVLGATALLGVTADVSVGIIVLLAVLFLSIAATRASVGSYRAARRLASVRKRDPKRRRAAERVSRTEQIPGRRCDNVRESCPFPIS
jgi:hypothetical protein